MGSKKSRQRQNRRDRRKAKASGYSREGTKNPRKKGHHAYDAPVSVPSRKKSARPDKSREDLVGSAVWTCPKCDIQALGLTCPSCGMECPHENL